LSAKGWRPAGNASRDPPRQKLQWQRSSLTRRPAMRDGHPLPRGERVRMFEISAHKKKAVVLLEATAVNA